MEGMGTVILGILLGYLAILIFAIVSLVALGLLIARRGRAARIVFASGLLCATVIAAVAALTLGEASHEPRFSSLFVLAALALLSAGAGQFIAALRDPRSYAVALGCAAGAVVVLAAPLLGGDAGSAIPGVQAFLAAAGPVFLVLTSLLLGVTSLIIALLVPFRPRPKRQAPDNVPI